ncbi:MAG: cation transporter [Clostridia bacterium]|nr:cation transporter [Clostridia bacterium]
MKTEKNILIAFILNLAFSIFEMVGGIITGSVAIASDALHDLGDAVSIGISYLFERKSRRQPDEVYTYGYARSSVLGGIITTLILLVGSVVVLIGAVLRIITPVKINYGGMIVFAIFGVIVNLIAAYVTHGGDSINQKAVNLHMLEDVLGWLVVLIGAFLMHFTDWALLDPLLSIGVTLFILVHAAKNLREGLRLVFSKRRSTL